MHLLYFSCYKAFSFFNVVSFSKVSIPVRCDWEPLGKRLICGKIKDFCAEIQRKSRRCIIVGFYLYIDDY